MEKLNIAELLKDCPKGMELDCAICDDIYFDEVTPHAIKCFSKNNVYNTIYFNHDGTYIANKNAKCVIFPKGKTTWEGFQRPFKDGDIISNYRVQSICIFKKEGSIKGTIDYYCGISFGGLYVKDEKNINEHFGEISNYILASEEEKEKLFKILNDNGYRWNVEEKTLEKLPKFKVGDWVEFKYYERKPAKVIRIKNNVYYLSSGDTLMFQDEHAWDLTTNKFDINTLVPFESRVLVRDVDHNEWEGAIFGRYDGKAFFTIGGLDWRYCIPYEGNEHLLGKIIDCDGFYKNWE